MWIVGVRFSCLFYLFFFFFLLTNEKAVGWHRVSSVSRRLNLTCANHVILLDVWWVLNSCFLRCRSVCMHFLIDRDILFYFVSFHFWLPRWNPGMCGFAQAWLSTTLTLTRSTWLLFLRSPHQKPWKVCALPGSLWLVVIEHRLTHLPFDGLFYH